LPDQALKTHTTHFNSTGDQIRDIEYIKIDSSFVFVAHL